MPDPTHCSDSFLRADEQVQPAEVDTPWHPPAPLLVCISADFLASGLNISDISAFGCASYSITCVVKGQLSKQDDQERS